MSISFKIYISFVLYCLYFLAPCTSYELALPKSWIVSCKPCESALFECKTCIGEGCLDCIYNIPNSRCAQCIDDLYTVENFYCDNTVSYHVLSCTIRCRMNTQNGFFRDGFCDTNSGECKCVVNPTTTQRTTRAQTTTTSRLTTSISSTIDPSLLTSKTTTTNPNLFTTTRDQSQTSSSTRDPNLFTTRTNVPCSFSLEFETEGKTVVKENTGRLRVTVAVKANRNECKFNEVISFKASTVGYTAKKNIDYYDDFGNGILEINPGKLTHDLYIRIVDDALIEPFEFFKLDISDISPSKYSKALDKVIYIEDNDFFDGIKTDIMNVFEISRTNEQNIIYYDQNGKEIRWPRWNDVYKIYPLEGGVNSTYNQLKIIVEVLSSPYAYYLHTIEVHDPERCNLESMNFRRLGYSDRPLENYMNSFILDKTPVIDIDYHKTFFNWGTRGDYSDALELNFIATKDNKFPTNCEIRVFAKEI